MSLHTGKAKAEIKDAEGDSRLGYREERRYPDALLEAANV